VTDRVRVKLLFDSYRTPRLPIGRILTCEASDDDVIVVGNSDAPIRWPVGQRRGRGARTLVVYGRLAVSEAPQRPSAVLPRIFRATSGNPSISAEIPRLLATADHRTHALANGGGVA
jgi:hypothetical protein